MVFPELCNEIYFEADSWYNRFFWLFFFINSDIVESPSNTGSKVYAERQFKGFTEVFRTWLYIAGVKKHP